MRKAATRSRARKKGARHVTRGVSLLPASAILDLPAVDETTLEHYFKHLDFKAARIHDRSMDETKRGGAPSGSALDAAKSWARRRRDAADEPPPPPMTIIIDTSAAYRQTPKPVEGAR